MLLRRFIRRLFARTSQGARASWPKLLFVALVLAALPALAYWRGLGDDPDRIGAGASEMVVETIEQAGQTRLNLVLKEKSGPRRIVVAAGMAEAFSIMRDLDLQAAGLPSVTAYTMTRQIADGLGGKVQRVVVNNATDRELFAKVVLAKDSQEVAVDAAPSDAIALALRTKAPIYVDGAVLDRIGVVSGR